MLVSERLPVDYGQPSIRQILSIAAALVALPVWVALTGLAAMTWMLVGLAGSYLEPA
jgi:hypothetical protein